MALETTSDLLTYLQDELNDKGANATAQAKYLDALDRAHKIIVSGGGELNVSDNGQFVERPYIFSWALEADPIIVNTIPVITTGTLAVTNDSTSITFSSAPANSVAGYHIKIQGKDATYKIAAHTGGNTGATLDGAYIDDTDGTASYSLFKLDYDFAPSSGNLMIPADKIRVANRRDWISLVGRDELEDKFPLTEVYKREPVLAGLIQQTASGLNLRLSHYNDSIDRLELYYVKVPTTLTTGGVDPILPAHHRIVIPHLAAFYLLRRKDDDRAGTHLETARRLFRAMKIESQQMFGGNDELFGVVVPWS